MFMFSFFLSLLQIFLSRCSHSAYFFLSVPLPFLFWCLLSCFFFTAPILFLMLLFSLLLSVPILYIFFLSVSLLLFLSSCPFYSISFFVSFFLSLSHVSLMLYFFFHVLHTLSFFTSLNCVALSAGRLFINGTSWSGPARSWRWQCFIMAPCC